MENQGFMRELQPGMEDEMQALSPPENSMTQTSEIAPLQLESHNSSDRSMKGMQDGLKIIITSAICFAVSVTIALILTIYLAPPQVLQHAGVVSDSKVCASTGEQLLKRGGSAVDAAIAVVLCEGLINPQHSGIGGGGFMLLRQSRTNETHLIDFMDSAPAELSAAPDKVNGLAVGIPGMLRGLEFAHKKYGKLRWLDVVMTVVEIAYAPVNVSSDLDNSIMTSGSSHIQNYFKSIRQSTKENTMNLTGLYWLLQSVAKNGADAFYVDYAEEIINTTNAARGVMTKEDLRNYKPREREPVRSTFLKMAVESVDSPGGGPLLLFFLNMMEDVMDKELSQWNSTEIYHYIIECLKFMYGHQLLLADYPSTDNSTESKSYEQPPLLDYYNVTKNVISTLISKEYASYLVNKIDPEKTHSRVDFYSVGRDFHPAYGMSQISVIDPNDDMVSMTVSLNGPFGSGLVTKNGIILNSHMMNFDNEQKKKNNAPAPGKRPQVLMSPTIIYNPSRPCGQRYAIGGANGNSLIAGLAEVIMNLLGHKMLLSSAVDGPRLDVQLNEVLGDTILHEASLPDDIITLLKGKQHKYVNLTSSISIVHAAAKVNETVYGHADIRSESEAEIY